VEDFLGSFFPGLVFAVIIAVRVISALKGRKRKQEQRTDRGFHLWANTLPASPGSAPVVPHTEPRPNREEEFSAWNLSVDEDVPPKSAPEPPRPEPRLAEIRPMVPPAKPPRETPEPIAAAAENYAPEIAEAGIPGEASRDTPVVNRVRSLSSLQQGFIWAEILGAPKGL
jgi:hypothetical protein